MADERLTKLKAKYQPVLDKITELKVQLKNLHVQDDKLVIRAQAKTKIDSNRIWDEIKRVDPSYASDLMAEIGFDADQPAAQPGAGTKPAAPPPSAQRAAAPGENGGTGGRTYTVKKGDTLSAIAQQIYGRSGEYRRIFEANRDQLQDADHIRPGQILKIPA